MNSLEKLDAAVITFLNGFARRSWLFDQAVAFLSVNHMLKGGVLMMLVWWAWFRNDDRTGATRRHIVVSLVSCMIALAVGRILALTLPYRERPLRASELDLLTPYGISQVSYDKLSSFPSDHAVLFFGLAAGLFFVSRAVGTAALLYSALFIALPRLYLGVHYPSDIVAGALIGGIICALANRFAVDTPALRRITGVATSKPALFYPCLFFLTYQIADLFEPMRDLIGGVFKAIRQMLV